MKILKYTAIFFCFFVLLFIFAKFFETNFNHFHDDKIESKLDTWQYVGDKRLRHKVFSAYFDDRREFFGSPRDKNWSKIVAVVRVISILPKVTIEDYFCHYRYSNGTFKVTHPCNLGLGGIAKFSVKFVHCPLFDQSDLPQDVGISYKTANFSNNLIKIRYPQNLTKYHNPDNRLAVCVNTPLHHNFNQALRIVEFVELYKLTGASKFYVYNDTSTIAVKQVLDYYKKEGIMEVFNWHHGKEYLIGKELLVSGIVMSMNECLYRAHVVDNIKYLALVDIDEILVTYKYYRLLDFLIENDKEDSHSFLFRNTFLFKSNQKDYTTVPKNSTNRFLYSQVIEQRENPPLPYLVLSKYVAKVNKVLNMGNHFANTFVNGSSVYKVDPMDGLSFHYREKCWSNLCTRKDNINDSTARKFSPEIWDEVDKVCGQIFESGICP